MDEGTPLLLEPTDAGRVLNLSASRVRELADDGRLAVAGRTKRGIRLFEASVVEALREQRALAAPKPRQGTE